MNDGELEREALRLCDRYVREVVLAYGLCPWAEAALRTGRVARAVCLAATPTPADCLPFIDRLDHGFEKGFDDGFDPASGGATDPVEDPATGAPVLDIGLLIFPRHRGSWAAFDAFAEKVRRADRQRVPAGTMPAFHVAAFHPGGAETFTDANQLVSLLRRSPDPLLQFVRGDAIRRVKAIRSDASDEVARNNHQMLTGVNADRLESLERAMRSIGADRDASYARMGLHTNSP